jgi:hypothetical protein
MERQRYSNGCRLPLGTGRQPYSRGKVALQGESRPAGREDEEGGRDERDGRRHAEELRPGRRGECEAERRLRSSPGIRITTADLEPAEAEALAATLAGLRESRGTTYTG